MRASLISPSVKDGGLTRAWSTLASSSSWGTSSPWGRAPALAISFSSLQAAFLRVFMIPIITTIELDAKSHNKYTLSAPYKIFKKERDSYVSYRFLLISVAHFKIMNTNLYRCGRERYITQWYSTSWSDTKFITSGFTPRCNRRRFPFQGLILAS